MGAALERKSCAIGAQSLESSTTVIRLCPGGQVSPRGRARFFERAHHCLMGWSFLMRALSAFALCGLLSLSSAAFAQDDGMTADQLVEKLAAKGSAIGFSEGTATLEMVITTEKGAVKNRTMEIKAMREDELLRTLAKFTRPAEVAGISFLVLEKKDALPAQYVYVPAAKVVRRIPPGNASSSFFGSDFAFVDLMPLPMSEKDKVEINRLPDAQVSKQDTYVLEAKPLVEGSPYGKLVTYVHKKLLLPVKVEFFDEKMKPLKTLKVKKIKKVKGEHVPVEMVMENVQKGSNTVLVIAKMNPNAKLSSSDFTEEAMQR